MSNIINRLNALAKDGDAIYHECRNFQRCKGVAVGEQKYCKRCTDARKGKDDTE